MNYLLITNSKNWRCKPEQQGLLRNHLAHLQSFISLDNIEDRGKRFCDVVGDPPHVASMPDLLPRRLLTSQQHVVRPGAKVGDMS